MIKNTIIYDKMDKIKVLAVDANIYYRSGIKGILSREPDILIIGADPDENLIELIEKENSDVILLDIGSDSCNLALGEQIIQRYPNIRMIILSTFPDDSELFDVLKIGSVAYIDKNSNPKDMSTTIREAYQGKYPINEYILSRPKVAAQVLQGFQKLINQKTIEVTTVPITPRETEILPYICNGNSNKQIASMLSISEQTIKNHVSSILRKLNANDRAHAAMLAVRRGLIPFEDIK